MMKDDFTNGCDVKADVPDDQKGRHYDVFEETAVIAQYLRRLGVLSAIAEQVHFARRRFGTYDVIDFLAVLIGYAISSERTLEAFYEHLHPFASTFMALFGRDRLPARSTLSRFLASLTSEPIEALRSLMLSDLLTRSLDPQEHMAGLWDRAGSQWHVFDIDGTHEPARQRALPVGADRPAPQRRLRPLCAPGYTGRKRGEIVRTRTTVLHAHTHQWLATFGNSGKRRSLHSPSVFPGTSPCFPGFLTRRFHEHNLSIHPVLSTAWG